MVQIIPENRRMNRGQQLGAGLGNALSSAAQSYMAMANKNEENEALKRFGINAEGLNPEFKKLAFQHALNTRENQFKADQKANDLAGKRQQELIPFQEALSTIDRLENIGNKGNLGRFSSVRGFFGGETAQDIGEYETLAKSLASYASNIPIRNQAEFNTLVHDLYDSSLPDSRRKGILNALRQIIQRSIKSHEGPQDQMPSFDSNLPSFGQMNSNKPPLSSFMR